MAKKSGKEIRKTTNNVKVSIKGNFSRSTNLKHDFDNVRSLDHLVLSSKFQTFFKLFSEDVLNVTSKSRVHVISGTPGTGKSTFALFLARILSKTGSKYFTQQIEIQRQRTGPDFNRVLETIESKNIKLLPVFLNGDEGVIEEAFVSALSSAFERVGLKESFEDLLKEDSQHYLKLVRMWEQDYPTKYEELKSIIESESKKDFSQFISNLRKGSRSSQRLFDEAYREVTGGAAIRQFAHSQVVELYKKANKALSQKRFNGITIFYDEFGKYLERGTRNPTNFDLQFIQEIAEACNTSGQDQLHLVLLSHLPISQYAASLPTAIQQEWAKIEGRFQQVSFNDNAASAYSLIASAFEPTLKDEHPSIWASSKKEAQEWISVVGKTKSLTNFLKVENCSEICATCFPLHPSVISILPLLSERVAQNERTLFSFLTRDEENSLVWFLKHNEETEKNNTYLSPYSLYQYFRPLIANDVGIGGTYKVYLIAERALNSLSQDQMHEKEVIALLAIASVINNRTVLKPSANVLSSLLTGLCSPRNVKAALEELEKLKLVIYDRVSQEYNLFEGSAVDLREELNKIRPRTLTSEGYAKILRTTLKRSFLLPKKYNFSASITRFLAEEIVSLETFEKIASVKPDFSKEDGRVLFVLPFSQKELVQAREIASRIQTSCTLAVLPNQPLEIESDLLELHAIEQMYSMKELLSASPNAKRELDHYRATCISALQRSCQIFRSMTQMNCAVFYNGNCQAENIRGIPQLSDVASQVMEKEYSKSPKFNNEMINRRRVSNPIIQARIRLVDHIDSAHLSRWGISGTGPEFSILQSLQISNTFSFNNGGKWKALSSKSALAELYDDFLEFLRGSNEGPILFQDLIDRWVQPPFGIRVPLLPIYVSIFCKIAPSPVSFYLEGQFVSEQDSLLFENVLKHPRKYSLQMIEVTPKLLGHLREITSAFQGHIPGDGKDETIGGFLDAAKAVSRYFSLVPEFSRRSTSLTNSQRKLITSLETFKQPEEFFLKTLPTIYADDSLLKMNSAAVADMVALLSTDVEKIFSLYIDLLKGIASHTRTALSRLLRTLGNSKVSIAETGAPLAKFWKESIEGLSSEVRDYPYGGVTQKFINRVIQLNNSMPNQMVIETLGDSLTGSSPRDWNDRGRYLYEFNLDQAINQIVQMHLFMSDDKGAHATITTVGADGLPMTTEIGRGKISTKLRKNIEAKLKVALDGLTTAEINGLLIEWLFENNKKSEGSGNITTKSKIGEAWG